MITIKEKKYTDSSNVMIYHNFNNIQFNQAKKFIDEHGKLIRGKILDIGSGDGKVTAYIANEIVKPYSSSFVTGLDISTERVNFSQENYASSQLNFIVGNALDLNENKMLRPPYDTIVSFNTLHHLPRSCQLSFFTQARQLLHDEGIGLFLIPGRSKELHDSIHETVQNNIWKKYFSEFDINQVRTYENAEYYQKICQQTGFYSCNVTNIEEEGGTLLNKNNLMQFIKGWLPHLAHLKLKNIDDFTQDQFLEDITNLYFQKRNIHTNQSTPIKINQNKVVAYASQAGFFKYNTLNNVGEKSSLGYKANCG